MNSKNSKKTAYHTAIDLLTRREHSRQELSQKLKAQGFSVDEIDFVLDQLIRENLQSDARYAELYIVHRRQKGYGPLRIRQELRERGIVRDLIEQYLHEEDEEWFVMAKKSQQKKFGSVIPKYFREQAKQMRYLQYCGFNQQHIQSIFKESEYNP